MNETKICTKCRNELPTKQFYKSASSSDGLQGYCKSCVSEYKKSKPSALKTSKPFPKHKVGKRSGSKIRLLF